MLISPLKIVGWLLLWMALCLLPIAVVMAGERPPPRGWLVEAGAMLGLLGLGMLAMQCVITGRHRWFARGVGQDNLLQFHRRTGVFAWAVVLAHPALLVLGDPAFLAWMDPREGLLRAAGVWFLALATSALIVTSLWRVSLKLGYELWRTLHAVLSLLVVAGGLGHALMGQHHTAGLGTQLALGLIVGVPLAFLLETRLWRPRQLARQPWRVVEVEERRAESTRLLLEADGHPGLAFRPGQYAWLTLGYSPYTLQQNPFSMASSPTDPRRVEFIAKNSGDFTSQWPRIDIGTRAFLEGPYGVFSIDVEANRRAVFVAGGIGITPILSMLRSCRDRGHSAPMWLVYANQDEASIIAREALDALSRALPLTIVHVLNEPGEAWTGETGHVDAELLARHLPADAEDIDYFVCGPTPLMDQVEPALLERGAGALRLYSERFDLV
jgi:predicted ferric reductase